MRSTWRPGWSSLPSPGEIIIGRDHAPFRQGRRPRRTDRARCMLKGKSRAGPGAPALGRHARRPRRATSSRRADGRSGAGASIAAAGIRSCQSGASMSPVHGVRSGWRRQDRDLSRSSSRPLGRSASVVKGRCLAYGEGITFWPIAEIVATSRGHQRARHHRPKRRAKIAVAASCGSMTARSSRSGVAANDGALSAQTCVRGETFWAVRRLFECLADDRPARRRHRRYPLGRADPPRPDREHRATGQRDASIQLICTARPELLDERTGWGGGKPNAASVLLGRSPRRKPTH